LTIGDDFAIVKELVSTFDETSMIRCPTVQKQAIRWHYDLSTLFYRLLWGRHLHHGLWDDGESPIAAAQNLTETLARLAGIRSGEQIVDIGCGMGGSSIHLAKALGCDVTGITLSPLQRRWAVTSAWWHDVRNKTDFRCLDAEQTDFPAASWDVVWSIECTEHLFDKAGFFHRAAEWLRSGGRVAICAWLAGDPLPSAADVQQVYDVCEGFLCPSLGTASDYTGWLTQAGLEIVVTHDWTERVQETWAICDRRVRRTGLRWVAPLFGRNTVLFLKRFPTILNAYRSGAMRYGCFVARKP
jgi:cyclopropane fatty-acyl-phospholipid synthase-like methyltransferase